ncbi:MAG TPA: polysaccharide biosynthesis protein, partial [Luteolibacter sp.]
QQIAHGGPITITDRRITRFFMTIPEAAQLVIQAGAMATGGEVFLLDMGEPVRIVDLARNMVELSGRTIKDAESPYGDIELREVGLRPGEKLYEELLIDDTATPTAHPRIRRAQESYIPLDQLEPQLTRLEELISAADANEVRELIRILVQGFSPNSGIADWVQLEKLNVSGKSAAGC